MGKYRVTRFFPIGFLVVLTILENFTIGFLVVSKMPGVKGKSTPRKPPRSPKKLSKSQKIAKKLKQWNDLCKRIQKAKYLNLEWKVQSKNAIIQNFRRIHGIFEKWAKTLEILENSWNFWIIEKIGKFMVRKLTKVFEIMEISLCYQEIDNFLENLWFFWKIEFFCKYWKIPGTFGKLT